MSRIYITTLGGLRIVRGHEQILDLHKQPVRCALFLYLAMHRLASRDELATILWPERSTDRTRHSLSQTLYELRRQLGDEIIRSQGNQVEIAEKVQIDALEFRLAAESGKDEQAYGVYSGTFLKGIHLGISNEFESWVDRTRFELERHYRDVCRRLSGARLEHGDEKGALSVVRRWVSINPLEDEAQHLLIKLLAQLGRRAEALQQYDRYRELIGRELDVEPLDQTEELIRQIREEKPAVPVLSKQPTAVRSSEDSPEPGRQIV